MFFETDVVGETFRHRKFLQFEPKSGGSSLVEYFAEYFFCDAKLNGGESLHVKLLPFLSAHGSGLAS